MRRNSFTTPASRRESAVDTPSKGSFEQQEFRADDEAGG
jgi:hypothetical protein